MRVIQYFISILCDTHFGSRDPDDPDDRAALSNDPGLRLTREVLFCGLTSTTNINNLIRPNREKIFE